MTHIPVLLQEVLRVLDPKPGENIVDCTVGLGGHALALLEKTAPTGKLLGIDADADSLERFKETVSAAYQRRCAFAHGNFADIENIVQRERFLPVSGVLMDLGLSSWQLEESGRGFSFRKDEPLDMRFDIAQQRTAAEVVNRSTEKELERILREYGEERFSRQIANRIIEERRRQHITRTTQLAAIVVNAIPPRFRHGKAHAATKTFQAVRMAVNNELDNLLKALNGASHILAPGGRLIVISFHSLEDRIVKNFLRGESRTGHMAMLTKKPVTPSADELRENPRARSAKLRAAVKIGVR